MGRKIASISDKYSKIIANPTQIDDTEAGGHMEKKDYQYKVHLKGHSTILTITASNVSHHWVDKYNKEHKSFWECGDTIVADGVEMFFDAPIEFLGETVFKGKK